MASPAPTDLTIQSSQQEFGTKPHRPDFKMEELLGCWREARRVDNIAASLASLRATLDIEFTDHIMAVLREVESTSRLLRDIYDLFPVYRSRVPIILYYLNVLLPSLCRSLKDMALYLEHGSTYTFWHTYPLTGRVIFYCPKTSGTFPLSTSFTSVLSVN